MRIHNLVLCLALLVGVCASCAGDADFDSAGEHGSGSIVLRIGTGVKTRTELAGSYNLNHVRQVYAILYEGTGDDATYVCHHDLKWSPVDSTDYGEGVVQEKVYEFSVPSSIKSNGEYTLLCVGLDDQSGTTYGLSLTDNAAPSFCDKNKTLADAKAILATTSGSMTKAELFAGWTTFTYSRKDENSVEVELTRRVSGVYAYLKDIPVNINSSKVEQIQLVLGNLPNTQIGLARKERSDDGKLPDDFGSNPTTDASAKVLDKLTLADIAKANTNTNLYDINTTYTDALGLTEQTLLLSAYLLPMKADDTNGTLAIELLDASGALIKSFPAQWDNVPTSAGDKEKYSLYPNYVYHVGTRSDNSDRPASLAGNRIVLEVQPWTEVEIKTEFPKVPLEATIDYDKNPSSYIYDCINTTDKITIMPSLLKRKWKMTIVAEDNNGNLNTDGKCDWIYFVKAGNTYTQELTSSDYTNGNEQAVAVTIRLCDYVVQRDYNPSTSAGQTAINTDWRRARIVLETENSSSPTHLSIRQYNAITVTGQYDRKTTFSCGFSRYDYGVERDKDGAITNQGYMGKWGFVEQSNTDLYSGYADAAKLYYDGYYAHENIESKWTSNTSYWGTDDISTQPIVRYSWTASWVYEGGQQKLADSYWYLPSQYELYGFFNDMGKRQPSIEANIVIGGLYWSSSSKFNSYSSSEKSHRSYCQKLEAEGKLWVSDKKDGEVGTRTFRKDANLGYSRRARHFEGYTGGLQ